MAEIECTHLVAIQKVKPSAKGCEECLKIGSRWLHLRICRTCGASAAATTPRHATEHFHATQLPDHRGLRPMKGWSWCYVDGDVRPRRQHHAAVGSIPRYY